MNRRKRTPARAEPGAGRRVLREEEGGRERVSRNGSLEIVAVLLGALGGHRIQEICKRIK